MQTMGRGRWTIDVDGQRIAISELPIGDLGLEDWKIGRAEDCD